MGAAGYAAAVAENVGAGEVAEALVCEHAVEGGDLLWLSVALSHRGTVLCVNDGINR